MILDSKNIKNIIIISQAVKEYIMDHVVQEPSWFNYFVCRSIPDYYDLIKVGSYSVIFSTLLEQVVHSPLDNSVSN